MSNNTFLNSLKENVFDRVDTLQKRIVQALRLLDEIRLDAEEIKTCFTTDEYFEDLDYNDFYEEIISSSQRQ